VGLEALGPDDRGDSGLAKGVHVGDGVAVLRALADGTGVGAAARHREPPSTRLDVAFGGPREQLHPVLLGLGRRQQTEHAGPAGVAGVPAERDGSVDDFVAHPRAEHAGLFFDGRQVAPYELRELPKEVGGLVE
jgi:hypothetical protein